MGCSGSRDHAVESSHHVKDQAPAAPMPDVTTDVTTAPSKPTIATTATTPANPPAAATTATTTTTTKAEETEAVTGDLETNDSKDNVITSPVKALQNFFAEPGKKFFDHVSPPSGKEIIKAGAYRLKNVFAVPLDYLKEGSGPQRSDSLAGYQLPIFSKSSAECDFIDRALKNNFVFEGLTSRERYPLIDAFQKYEASAGEVIIRQGDGGLPTASRSPTAGDESKNENEDDSFLDPTEMYFYIIYSGCCQFSVDGNVVGKKAISGDSFGELALLYSCPRAATVTALTPTVLFRVDQHSFRYILEYKTKEGKEAKKNLLRGVEFLYDKTTKEPLIPISKINQLAENMTPRNFDKGDVILQKGTKASSFFVLIESGTVLLNDADITVLRNSLKVDERNNDEPDGKVESSNEETGPQTESISDIRKSVVSSEVKHFQQHGTRYENVTLGPGEFFGHGSIIADVPPLATFVAVTDVRAFVIDADIFKEILGNMGEFISKLVLHRALGGLKIFKDCNVSPQTIEALAQLITRHEYKVGETIFAEGEEVEPALYLIKEGGIEKEMQKDGKKFAVTLGKAGYFGDDQLLADAKRGNNFWPATCVAEYSIRTTHDSTFLVLKLKDCRQVMNTLLLGGQGARAHVQVNLTMNDLEKHRILGAGTFGQVWLVSRNGVGGTKEAYALKVQSKYELCRSGQAKAVVEEKNIMASLHHPFITTLVSSFQDDQYVYMLMRLEQGGELHSIMHSKRRNFLPESEARFYVAGIAEGLGYMHSMGYVYRDLKPENVLISNDGYPVLVDLGFAKYVEEKTYTFCGTPLYLAPEIILNRGHDGGADNWSMGVLMFEMLTGYTPFYEEGMDQMELFRAIVKSGVHCPKSQTKSAVNMIKGLLRKDPNKRLGSRSDGIREIATHDWFAGMDFDKLRAKLIDPPQKPTIKDPLDASNFQIWNNLNDKLQKRYPRLTAKQAAIFTQF